MAKRTFDDWLGDLREVARDNLGVDLEELGDFDEDGADHGQAFEAFKNGEKPRSFLKEIHTEDREEDLTEIMREL